MKKALSGRGTKKQARKKAGAARKNKPQDSEQLDWVPQGVSDLIRHSVTIDTSTREHIVRTCRVFGIDRVPDAFFEELSRAVTSFKAGRELAEKTKPSAVRDNLAAAIAAASSLQSIVSSMDANSLSLIAKTGCTTTRLRDDLEGIVSCLTRALELSGEYPKGRLPDFSRLLLARDLALIVECHFDVKSATSTTDGLYESILAVVIELATGKPASSVHDLAQRGIEAARKGVLRFSKKTNN